MKMKSQMNRLGTNPSVLTVNTGQMTSTCAAILWKLHSRGLRSQEIFRLVKDVIHILENGGSLTVSCVNLELEALGWPRWIVDDISLDLIVQLMENAFDYEKIMQTVH